MLEYTALRVRTSKFEFLEVDFHGGSAHGQTCMRSAGATHSCMDTPARRLRPLLNASPPKSMAGTALILA
jgi:hypothetical protein